jgi:hypothetical protein
LITENDARVAIMASRASARRQSGERHGTDGVGAARHQLHALVMDLLRDGVATGAVRDDIPLGELASYCLHALTGAADVPADAAVTRLVSLIL